MKKVIIAVIAMIMMVALCCGCESHEHSTTTTYTFGETITREYYDGVLISESREAH